MLTLGSLATGASPPAATYRYYRQFFDAINSGADPDAVIEWGSAELLYMIVMRDCENAEQFRSDEIGDFDGDGLMEFHDAWGHPIRFIRWPAGFVPDTDGNPKNDAIRCSSREIRPKTEIHSIRPESRRMPSGSFH